MDEIKKYEGSVSDDAFILGLLSRYNTFGDIWEQCISCDHCAFKKQCEEIGEVMEDNGKNPTCGQIISILTGEIKIEDVK
jgi:hypothetical protein